MGKRSKRQQSASSEKILDTSSPAPTRGSKIHARTGYDSAGACGGRHSLNHLSHLRCLV